MQKKTIGMLMLAGTLLGAVGQANQAKAATPTTIQSVTAMTKAKTFRYSYYERTTDGQLVKVVQDDITTDNPNPKGGIYHGSKNVIDVQPDGPIVDGVQGFRVTLERINNNIYFKYVDEAGNEINRGSAGLIGSSGKIEPGMAVYQKEVAQNKIKISQQGYQIVSMTSEHKMSHDVAKYVLVKSNSDVHKPEAATVQPANELSSPTTTDNQETPEKVSVSSALNELPNKGTTQLRPETPKPVNPGTDVVSTVDASIPEASQVTTGSGTVVSPDLVAGNEETKLGQSSNASATDTVASIVPTMPNTSDKTTLTKPNGAGSVTSEIAMKPSATGSITPNVPMKPTTSGTGTITMPTKPSVSGAVTPITPVTKPMLGATFPVVASPSTGSVNSESATTRPVSTTGKTNQVWPDATVKPTISNQGAIPIQIKIEVQPVEQTGNQTTSSNQTKRQIKPTKAKHKQGKHKQTKRKGKQQTKRTVKGKITQTKKKTAKQTQVRRVQQQLVKLLKQLLVLQK